MVRDQTILKLDQHFGKDGLLLWCEWGEGGWPMPSPEHADSPVIMIPQAVHRLANLSQSFTTKAGNTKKLGVGHVVNCPNRIDPFSVESGNGPHGYFEPIPARLSQYVHHPLPIVGILTRPPRLKPVARDGMETGPVSAFMPRSARLAPSTA